MKAGRRTSTYLRNTKETGGVAQTPVTQLVGKNSGNLLCVALLNQSVIDDNVLLPGHAEEVGIAVRAPLATINNKQLRQRKLEIRSESFHLGLERTGFQGSELVEHGRDDNRPNGDHEDLETSAKQPQVVEELLPGLLDDCEEGGQNGRSQHDSQAKRLDLVCDVEAGGLLVEAELLLQDERVVDRRRRRQKLGDDGKGQNKDDRLGDFTGEPSGRVFEQQVARP